MTLAACVMDCKQKSQFARVRFAIPSSLSWRKVVIAIGKFILSVISLAHHSFITFPVFRMKRREGLRSSLIGGRWQRQAPRSPTPRPSTGGRSSAFSPRSWSGRAPRRRRSLWATTSPAYARTSLRFRDSIQWCCEIYWRWRENSLQWSLYISS